MMFYYQLFRVSTSASQLHEYAWMRVLECSEGAESAIVRSHTSGAMRALKIAFKTDQRVNEAVLNTKIGAASKHVMTVHSYGTTTQDLWYAIGELVVSSLTSRITAGFGIADDEEFWQLASQLVSGMTDIHASNLIHHAIQV